MTRVCIVGCGAVGSLFAANLAQLDDVEVWAFDLNQAHVDAIEAHGLRLTGAGTVHANTGADVVARFEALGALAGLAPAAVHAQLLSAVQVVVHVRRGSGRRIVDTVAVLARGAEGRPQVESALMRGGAGETVIGPAWPALARLLDLDPDVVP